MNDLYMTHLLHQRIDDLRRTGEARAAVRRALRERREASAPQPGVRAVPASSAVAGTSVAIAACAGPTATRQAPAVQAPAVQAPAPCCAVGA